MNNITWVQWDYLMEPTKKTKWHIVTETLNNERNRTGCGRTYKRHERGAVYSGDPEGSRCRSCEIAYNSKPGEG